MVFINLNENKNKINKLHKRISSKNVLESSITLNIY